MPPDAMLAVLVGAVLHAGWNALIKGGAEKLVDTALVAGGAAIISACALPFLPVPDPASWPYLGASVMIHVGYFLLVAAAYRTGDMSYAYPLMRGSAPLLVALASAVIGGERLSGGGWLGMLLISGGVMGLALGQRYGKPRHLASGPQLGVTGYALGNATVIAVYTLVDGLGARASGHAVSYTSILVGIGLAALLLQERFGWTRYAAALVIVLGAVALRAA